MNTLAEFAHFIECEMSLNTLCKLYGVQTGNKLWKLYRRAESPFTWYLSLTIDQSDHLYIWLLRRSGERRIRRKMISNK